MMQTRSIKYFVVLIFLSGCIKTFEPDFNNESVNKLVVQGLVSSIEGWQHVSVSRTSKVSEPKYIPVNNCTIKIIDDLGQTFNLNQYEDGEYRVWMPEIFLVPGRSYKIEVITPEGEILESAFDQMPTGPEVGDIYYEIKPIPTNDPDIITEGIQIYTDFIADEEDSRYYRWKLTETWEYHAQFAIESYYDGVVHQVSPPDSSLYFCWNTNPIANVITLSTTNFSTNTAVKFPLNYVNNRSPRLEILYSLLIEQNALSEDAYNYWDELRLNSEQNGGLYNSQPIAVKGNMINTSNPDAEVLGFFQASTVSLKRIFIEPVSGLELDYQSRCSLIQLEFGLQEIMPRDYPAYLVGGTLLTKDCVECTTLGGSTDKPPYWP